MRIKSGDPIRAYCLRQRQTNKKKCSKATRNLLYRPQPKYTKKKNKSFLSQSEYNRQHIHTRPKQNIRHTKQNDNLAFTAQKEFIDTVYHSRFFVGYFFVLSSSFCFVYFGCAFIAHILCIFVGYVRLQHTFIMYTHSYFFWLIFCCVFFLLFFIHGIRSSINSFVNC